MSTPPAPPPPASRPPAAAPSGPASPGGAPAYVPRGGPAATSRPTEPGADQPPARGQGAIANAAAQQAKDRVPYADKAAQAKQVLDAGREGGVGAGAERAAGLAGATAAKAGASALTGGATDAAGAIAPQVSKVIEKIGERLGTATYKGTVKVLAAAGTMALVAVLALTGTLGAFVASMSGRDHPPAPTQDQCDAMPEGWCEVVYDAQKVTHNRSIQVPWTVLAGIARSTTDYGRTSPYDTVDRFPDRPIPPYLAANFSLADTGIGGPGGSTIPYAAGSLAWGGYENGRIPDSALCALPAEFGAGHRAECSAAAALIALNEEYKSGHGGASLQLTSGYRDYAGQVAARSDWCARGSCGNAATPGTSNHGWAKAVDFRGFGSIGVYTDPDYLWMLTVGPKYGWHNPPYMQAGGKGPHEPWHFEYRGGGATVASAATEREALTAGAQASGDLTCEDLTPTTAIGGQGRQAAGPFLLTAAAAGELADDDGGDANNPCDAAKYVARALAETAAEIAAEDGKPAANDQAAGAAFWQKVITESGIIADPSLPSGDCTTVGAGLPVGQMIERIWACEATAERSLHVVSGVTSTDAAVSFAEYARQAGVDTLIAEAKSVAWASSRYGQNACSESDPTAGVFPLTAQEAADAGLMTRCDQPGNIAAAARIVLSGEAVPVADRDTAAGPFAPMTGGWSRIAAVLSPDSSLAVTGPAGSWEAATACTSAVDDYLIGLTGPGSVFAELAGSTTVPEDSARFAAAAGTWPQTVLGACPGAGPADLADLAATLASGHVDGNGPVVSRGGEQAPAPAAPEPTGEIPVEEAPVLPELTAGPGSSVPAVPAADPQAMAGAAVWFSWQSAQERATVGEAVLGQHSLVPRLSSTGHVPPAPPVAASAVTSSSAWATRATEWAVFYGGTVRQFNTFGTRTGSLLASLTGNAQAYGATSGDTASQVQAILDAAKRYLGTPYSWGGGGPNGPSEGSTGVVGFDCSGLTEYAFAQAGYQIGGWTGVQKDAGTAVGSLAEAQPGDLLFFGSPVRHVAIYLGDNQLIHAPKPGDVVKISPVYETPTVIRRVVVARAMTGDVDTWIASALEVLYANGVAPAQTDAADLREIIMRESSGNPAAVNKTDSNWAAGHPSFGLMQTIPSTFDAHALGGYTDKNDPVAQIIAGARYAISRYGSIHEVPGLVALRSGQPYVGY